jgi:hypothetical protein
MRLAASLRQGHAVAAETDRAGRILPAMEEPGMAWLLMTLAFEFGFGALVQHRKIDEMLAAYTFRDGNIWPLVLVLVVTLLSPVLARRARLAMA